MHNVLLDNMIVSLKVILKWNSSSSLFIKFSILFHHSVELLSSFDLVARSAVLLKPNVANILLFNFCEKKKIRSQHRPITIAIDCNGHS